MDNARINYIAHKIDIYIYILRRRDYITQDLMKINTLLLISLIFSFLLIFMNFYYFI